MLREPHSTIEAALSVGIRWNRRKVLVPRGKFDFRVDPGKRDAFHALIRASDRSYESRISSSFAAEMNVTCDEVSLIEILGSGVEQCIRCGGKLDLNTVQGRDDFILRYRGQFHGGSVVTRLVGQDIF